MAGFWKLFKQSLHREYNHMANLGAPSSPQSSGTGGGGNASNCNNTQKEWELVYRKFRQINRRDPYSFQELVDWWNRV